MIAHILNAGVRALAATLILGGVLIYAVGGIDSPDAGAIVSIVIIGFFIFWLVFTLLFGKRVPSAERGSQNEIETAGPHRAIGQRRETDEAGDQSDTAGEGGGDGDASD